MRVLPTRWWQKPSSIDMERNYVTVTVCIPTLVVLTLGFPNVAFSMHCITCRIIHVSEIRQIQ